MSVKVASNAAAIRERLKITLSQRVRRRAKQLSGIAKDLHRDAPRGGENRNKWGEKRSAPDEPPAMEDGVLFAKIDQGVTEVAPAEATTIVNYSVLEYGYTLLMQPKPGGSAPTAGGVRVLRPRPLGRLSVAQLKAEVDAE